MKANGLAKSMVFILIVAMFFTMGMVYPSSDGLESERAPAPDFSDLDFSCDSEKVDVLIGFYDEPGIIEVNMVEFLGGEIYKQFSLVNVVAASLTPKAIDELVRNPSVEYVEPDAPVYSLSQSMPWGIERVFGPESYQFDTWEFTRGDGVAVAIIDSGIEDTHEDLYPSVLGGINTVGHDPSNYLDGNGHGTHVAGTVAALDNEIGVVGVGPEIGLYAVKVLDDYGSGSWSSVAAGIEWAVDNDIPVLNMSLGGSDGRTMRDACNAAYAAGHLLVAAAGNSGNHSGTGNNVAYPAGYSSVIAVAASDSNDNRASFSSTGPAVELIAPGLRVLSTWRMNRYINASGTSMASPHVAGVAALTWSANPELTNVEVREILQETAEDLSLPQPHQGEGMVRADLAVRAALDLVDPATGIIEGIVTDEQDRAVAGAIIEIKESDLSAVTDDNGYYRLEKVPAGEHNLLASAEKYQSQEVSVTLEKGATLTRDFTLQKRVESFTITATAGPGGEIKPSGAVEVNAGENQAFEIIPSAGFVINDVLVDGDSVNAVESYTFENVEDDHTIHVSFLKTHFSIKGTVTNYAGDVVSDAVVAVEESGFSAVTGPDGQYLIDGLEKGTYEFTVSKDGYHMESKTVDLDGDILDLNFVLRRSERDSYIINATAGTGGEIKPSAAVVVYAGESQTFEINPKEGFAVKDVIVDGESVDAVDSYTFENVQSDHSIHASFLKSGYSVWGKVTDYTGEVIKGAVVKVEGTDLSSVTGSDGIYSVAGLKEGTYEFTVSKDDYLDESRTVTIEKSVFDLNFALRRINSDIYVINATAEPGGEIRPSAAVAVYAGDSQTFMIKPDEGYVISDVLVDSESVEAVESYTFEDVNSDHKIHALFEKVTEENFMSFMIIFKFFKLLFQ